MASKHKFLYAREQRISSSETGSYQQKILSENKNVVSILQWVTGLPILFFWFAILGKIHTCLFGLNCCWILLLSPWKLHSRKFWSIRLTIHPLEIGQIKTHWKFHTIFSLSPPRGDSTAVLFELASDSGILHGHALSSSMSSVFNQPPFPCFHGPVGIFFWME